MIKVFVEQSGYTGSARKGEDNFPFSFIKKKTLKTLKPFKSCNNSDRASFHNIAMSFLFDICSTFVGTLQAENNILVYGAL